MSKKTTNIDFSKVAYTVIKTPVSKFAEESYLPYAHYVITSRALISDDGLKPVQRRLLYAMDQLGLTDKKDYIKAAQIVGETMGKYHPHGDSSIGDALSRMGQDFSLRVPLIDVQGSVGFTTGDEPAAPRYWEGRPTGAAMELLHDLKEGAIEMGLNYDGKFPEPALLPIKWPTGLINGSQGIAVGYSSTIVPHNPGEVMDAIIALVKNPDLSLKQIMKIMPGPDMPTGGVLIGYEGVKEYYETGRGTFSIRGKYKIVPGMRGTHQIIFNEAPYQVSSEQIITAVNKNKKDRGRFKEISYVKDLSDIENGFELSIGIKAGANPEVVLKDIFKWTPLEQTFSVNMNVLENGVPNINSIKEMLEGFIQFRSQCIINKTQFKLKVLENNIERLDGIIKVLVDIDKAINIIRNSENTNIANHELQKTFKINEEQSSYILSMPLRRLTKSDSLSIKKEIEEYKEEREVALNILNNKESFDNFMIKELKETKKVIADERRTKISSKSEEDLKAEEKALKKAALLESKNSDCYITLFSDNTIIKTTEPYVQKRSPVGIVNSILTKTKESLIVITKNGDAVKVPVSYITDEVVDISIPTGIHSDDIIGIGKSELDKDDHGLLLVSSFGGVNIVNKIPSTNEFQIIKLNEDEVVVKALWVTKDQIDKQIVLVASNGYATRFPLEQIRTSNSGAGTIKGITLGDNSETVGASVVEGETDEILTCTHTSIKLTSVNEITTANRGAKGVILHRLSKKDEVLVAHAGERVIANKNGRNLKLPALTERSGASTKRSGVDIKIGNF